MTKVPQEGGRGVQTDGGETEATGARGQSGETRGGRRAFAPQLCAALAFSTPALAAAHL